MIQIWKTIMFIVSFLVFVGTFTEATKNSSFLGILRSIITTGIILVVGRFIIHILT